jgi:glycosyltransferase involved in cell wall biosynthesis
MKATSVALVSVFPLYTGTTAIVLDYRRALSDLGYMVNTYQLVIPESPKEYVNNSYVMEGKRFPFKNFELPFNLLFILPNIVPELKEDIVFLSDPAILKLKKKFSNSVVIFYDLRDLSKFSLNPLRKIFYIYITKFVKSHDKIIAVSEFTKDILLSRFNLNLDVQIVDGCSHFTTDSSLMEEKVAAIKRGKCEINVLYIAADRPYKNIKLFIKVAEYIGRMTLEVKFNFILLSKLRNSTKRYILKHHLNNLEIIKHMDDIYPLYRKADILLYPSLIEGFGLPLVEAMSFGIPIIYSHNRPMKDIVGNSGIAVNPNLPELWVSELIKLSKKENYEKMARLSYERSAAYSYETFKEKLLEALKNFGYSTAKE